MANPIIREVLCLEYKRNQFEANISLRIEETDSVVACLSIFAQFAAAVDNHPAMRIFG